MSAPDPLYAGPRQGAQRPNGLDARTNGAPANDAETNQSRAAKFEDEKKRIIESCFSKRDTDGSQIESYITHVKIQEDAMYPSTPPPPDSAPGNKKSRVIVLAVRKSGRVRVHKARENPSGSYSIGKTWNLDDLTGIMIYDAFVPATVEEQSYKQWAGPAGFVVTMGKPYFWQAPTPKEKEFFIGSLIKIYRKYTGGRLPELSGFTSQALAQLQVSSKQPPSNTPSASASPQPQAGLPAPVAPFAASNRPQSPYTAANQDVSPSLNADGSRATSRDGYRPRTRDGQRTAGRDELRSPGRVDARQMDGETSFAPGSNARQRSPSVGQSTAQSSRLEEPPPMPGHLRVTTPNAPMSAKSSQSSLQPDQPLSTYDPRFTKTNGASSAAAQRNLIPQPLAVAPSDDSLRQRSEAGTSFSSRPSTATSDLRPPEVKVERPPIPEVTLLPERKRPIDNRPILSSDQRSIPSEASSKFATPLGTPSALRSEVGAPSQSSNKQPVLNDYFGDKAVDDLPSKDAAGPVSVEKTPIETPKLAPAVTTLPEAPMVTSEPEDMRSDSISGEEHRPGLGPMVKKKSAKDIANTFRRAALAATAFQPRAGGAAARFKAQQMNSTEPDGITGVVPAPLLRGMSTDSAASQDVSTPLSEKDRSFSPSLSKALPRVQLQRSATEDSVKSTEKTGSKADGQQKDARTHSPDKTRSRSPGRRRRQRQEAEIEKHCSALGIDPKILDGRGAEFNDLLTEFGWEGGLPEHYRIEDFEAEIRREIGRAQATGWLGHIEQQESKIQELARSFEKAIEECEELDGLLTLYAHELDTLHDDIQHIEAQSQGLQVQTANQKLLQNELHGLLKTLTISTSDLRGLRSAPLDTLEGVETVEHSLSTLYRAMITIDPEIRQNRIRQTEGNSGDKYGVAVYADTELGQMRAVREKKDDYRETTMIFLRRFSQHMTSNFKRAESRASEENSRSTASTSSYSLDLRGHQTLRQEMWVYNALLLFVREVNSYEWQTLISSYEMNIKSTFQDQFRDNIVARKKTVRKTAGDDHEYLFTHQEKEVVESGIASTTRKLTVRRGKTVKSHALRQSLGERREGGTEAWEVFDSILQAHAKLVSEEQNFIVHFFHLNSQSSLDFAELIATRPPQQRKLPMLDAKQSYDPDRNMAKIVQQTTDSIFAFWPNDLQSLVEWTLAADQLQGVGVLSSIEQCLSLYEETNQEYISRTLRTLHDRLTGLFHKFVDEQIKAIEETKVKITKRKGIISFIRVFPQFSTAVETMIPTEIAHHESLEVRFIVNDAYNKIHKAMWDSLIHLSKNDPAGGNAVGGPSSSGDPEDKATLNHHILLIENMNHYVEEVDTHHNVVLEEWAERARHDMFSHLTSYVDAIIRRPLGKWLEFLESTETLMKTTSDYAGIANRPSHSRSAAKKVLSAYDAKEVRKGVETLKKRVEKHFGDVDEGIVGAISDKGLVGRVLDECATRYSHAWDRMKEVCEQVYDVQEGKKELELEWRKEEVAAMFKR